MNFLMRLSGWLFLLPVAVLSTSLDWRVFSNSNTVWFYSADGIQIFSSSSRAVRPLSIDQTRKVDRLYDAVEFDGNLFVATDAGLYMVDMNSLGSERLSMPSDTIVEGKIAIDMDYVWLATPEALHSFDRLGEEWQMHVLPSHIGALQGVYTNGELVFCVGKNNVYSFDISTEKWDTFQYENTIPDSALFIHGVDGFKIVDNEYIRQYYPSSFSWELTATEKPVKDIFDEDSVLYYSVGEKVIKLTTSTNVVRPLDIPGVAFTHALSKLSDTLLLATEKRLVLYNTKSSSMEFIEYASGTEVKNLEKIVSHGSFVVCVYATNFAMYDKENRGWQIVPRAGLKQKIQRVSWDNDGLTMRYSPEYQSTLRGSIEENISFEYKGYEYETEYTTKFVDGNLVKDTVVVDSSRVYGYSIPDLPQINLNFRTTDPHDRSLDLFFNNTKQGASPQKGIIYRGNRDDRFNSLRVGTVTNEQSSSRSVPVVQLEGATIEIDSKKRVEGRDRKMVRITGGSGLITTRTEWKTLPFSSDGSYYLKAEHDSTQDSSAVTADTLQIVPGSVRVWVDGEVLDSSEYEFFNEISKLQFSSTTPVDPFSLITIQYKIQTISDKGYDNVEFIPEHNFGVAHFGAVGITPKEWISTRVAFTGLGRDTQQTQNGIRKVSPLINIMSPVEWRKKGQNVIIKVNPELSFNANTGKKSGSALLESRLGDKTGIVVNGMFVDSDYFTTDTLSFGYGAINKLFDIDVSYDITREIPLRYYQHYRNAAIGTENRYAAEAGVHFQGYPFFDVNIARTKIDHYSNNDSQKKAFDSLWDTKDKIRMRLYETSSKKMEKLTRAQRVSYDISHAEYRALYDSSEWVSGRMSKAKIKVSPINSITITGDMFFRKGKSDDSLPSMVMRPGLELQTVNAPKGIDFNAAYRINFGKYTLADSSSDTINRSIGLAVKPGLWTPSLKWLSSSVSISNDIYSTFTTGKPGFGALIRGNVNNRTTKMRENVGVTIFPSKALLFRNDNEFSQSNDVNTFTTESDAQLWLGTKNFWQAVWKYTTIDKKHTGSILYDRTWTHWMRTSPGFSANIATDSIGTNVDFGPSLKVNLNVQDKRIIRFLTNSHDFKVSWTRGGEESNRGTTIGYTFNLNIMLLPNFQINNFQTFTFKNSEFSEFRSESSLVVNF